MVNNGRKKIDLSKGRLLEKPKRLLTYLVHAVDVEYVPVTMRESGEEELSLSLRCQVREPFGKKADRQILLVFPPNQDRVFAAQLVDAVFEMMGLEVPQLDWEKNYGKGDDDPVV